MNTKTILVTGGAGFIGSHLCERLVGQGHRVISLDNYFTGSPANHVPGVEYRRGHTKDVARHVPETLDLIYHLGEYSRVEQSVLEPDVVDDLNTVGTRGVIEYWKQRRCKLVYAGSSTKFGDGGAARHTSPYARTKADNSETVGGVGEREGLPYAVTYFYNVYGGRERGRGAYATLVGIFKDQYAHGEPLTVVAPGSQERNFTHIDDTVDALILVGERGQGDEYGIGNPRGYSVAEVAALFGSEVVMVPARKGNRQTSTVDTTKTIALGWRPTRNLEDEVRAFTKTVPHGASAPERRVLVFSTTFHPIEGPAERAFMKLIASLPQVHFDIITTKFSPEAARAVSPFLNVNVYRTGVGIPFDKFLLPLLGVGVARTLQRKHRYLFMWSLMASYGGLAAILSKRSSDLPLLVTLADQHVGSRTARTVAPFILGQSDIGTDAFANALRMAYVGFLTP